MKKILPLVLIVLSLVSCKSNKDIKGEKIPLLQEDIILVADSKNKIKINKQKDTYINYYGDYSPLNKNIENFKIEQDKNYKIDFQGGWFSFAKFSNPILFNDNYIYFGDNGKLYFKDDKKKIFDSPTLGKITYHNGAVYLVGGTNKIVATLENGSEVWSKELGSVVISAPIVDGDDLFVITNDNKTYCLDANDGNVKWVHYGINKTTKILGVANPVVYKKYVIIAYSSGDLFILDRKDGNIIFNTNLTYKSHINSIFDLTDLDSTPLIKDDILYASANAGYTIAIDMKKISINWKVPVATLTNLVLNDEWLYVINTDNILIAMDTKDGKIAWYKDLGKEFLYTSLMFANDNLITFGKKGYKVVSPQGETLADFRKSLNLYSKPVSIGGILYGVEK